MTPNPIVFNQCQVLMSKLPLLVYGYRTYPLVICREQMLKMRVSPISWVVAWIVTSLFLLKELSSRIHNAGHSGKKNRGGGGPVSVQAFLAYRAEDDTSFLWPFFLS